MQKLIKPVVQDAVLKKHRPFEQTDKKKPPLRAVVKDITRRHR
jgi:hypothetical protein